MLGVFKQNNISSLVVLIVLSFAIKIKFLLHPPKIETLGVFYKGLFFQWEGLKHFYLSNPNVYVFFSICILIGVSLYINHIIDQEKLFQRNSYIPALSFMLFSSILPIFNIFSFELISGILVLIAVGKAFSLYNNPKSRRICFDIGILAALSCFFYFPSILFFVLLFSFIFVFRPFILQEIIAYILGFMTPLYIAVTLLFIYGRIGPKSMKLFYNMQFPSKHIHLPAFIVFSMSSIILLLYGLISINKATSRYQMVVRKKWNALIVYFIFASMVACLSMIFPATPWIIAIIPFSIILSTTLQGNKEKNNNFTLYFIVATVIGVQLLL